MASQLCLVLGGVRSGKSAFAEGRVSELSGADNKPVLYVATGVAFDDEMKDRIQRHRESRPQEWSTLEERVKLPEELAPLLAADQSPGTVIIDSVDVWVANLLMENQAEDRRSLEIIVTNEADKLLALAKKSSQAFVFVSSEVGLSLVPPEPLGRSFQDVLGTVNQRIAAAATEVYLVVAGIPTKIKASGTE
jgi:adenosylcobinamide kinase/adenosylcobinamide-phosphate guanylyltransferase